MLFGTYYERSAQNVLWLIEKAGYVLCWTEQVTTVIYNNRVLEFKVYIEDLLKRLSIIMRRLKNAKREFTKIYNFLLEKKQVDVDLWGWYNKSNKLSTIFKSTVSKNYYFYQSEWMIALG